MAALFDKQFFEKPFEKFHFLTIENKNANWPKFKV